MRPALDLLLQGAGDGARLLVEAPHQHGRPGARDGRAERPQLAGPAGELERAREQVRAALLVEAVLQAPGQQVPVTAGEPDGQQGGVGDVEDGLARSAPARDSAARAARVCGPARWAPPPEPPARSAGRASRPARRRRSRSLRGGRPRRCRGGPRWRVASASRSASSSNRWSAAIRPATIGRRARAEAARERDLRADREAEGRRPGAGARRPARRRFSRPLATGRSVSTAKLPVSETSSSSPRRHRRRHAVEAGSEVR